MKPGDLDELTPEEKRALLQRLLQQQQQQKGSRPETRRPAIQPRPKEGPPPPLSFSQERLWFLDQLSPGRATYNIPGGLRLDGPLDVAALERAFSELVRRHEALRTTFAPLDGRPAQRIAPPAPLPLPVVDLSALPPAERETEARRRAEEDARQPFDLAAGPLLRVQLLRLAPQAHLLLATMHHIITDGWSTGLLFGELGALYGAFREGRPSPLPELPLQYADFARWQRDWLSGEVLEAQLSWWRGQLAGTPVLELPTDHPRPPLLGYRGAIAPELSIPLPLTRALRELARKEGATLFMLLEAAFHALLHRYTGQGDLPVGFPVAGRLQAELEGLIGLFINTLVLRVDASGNPAFRELLARVRKAALAALAHQELPFEKLVEELKPERDLSRPPLIQALFDLQKAPTPPDLPGLSVQNHQTQNGATLFDLSVAITEREQGLTAYFEYNTDLFEPATIERMKGHYLRLLEGVVARPEARLGELPLLPAEERRQLLLEWNDTRVGYPSGESVHGLFQARAAASPDAVALTFEDQSLSYRELDVRSNRLARRLRALGVGPEVLVGLFLERSLDLVVGLFAILKAGGAYVPLDPSYPRERLAAMLEDSGAPLVLTHSRLASSLPPGNPHLALDSLAEALSALPGDALPGPAADPDSLAYVIFTSGSTGRPKGAMLEHRSVVNYLRWCVEAYRVAEGRGAPVHTSISFDLTVTSLLAPLVVGRAATLGREEEKAEGLAQALRTGSDYSLVKLTPSHLRLLAEQLAPGEAAGRTRAFVIGGEALPAEMLAFWREHAPGTRLINEYGPTETVVGCCVHEVGASDAPVGAVPIGRPIANTQLYVLDERLEPVPVGVAGELYIGGDGVGRGYLRRPELTAERFVPDPFALAPGRRLYRTGDLARYLPDGRLAYLGRLDHQVKLRGFRIELGEIEAVLRQHPALADAAVLAREDSPGDKRLVAYVVPAQGQAPAPAELRDSLRQRLPEYMVPSAIVALDALPVDANGKLDRRALPAPEGSAGDAGRYVAPRTPLEELLAGAFADLLRVERVGIHDSFFERGGHSLLATQVVSRVRQRFQVELPLRDIFEEPTVAGLTRRLQDAIARGLRLQAPPLVPVSRQGPLPLSFAQERLWFLDQLQPDSPLFNVPTPVRLQGQLDVAALEWAFSEVARRHEALRTHFAVVEGRPVQVISPPSPMSLPVLDLSGLPPAEREAELQRLADADMGRPFSLAKGPLWRLQLVRLAPEDHALLMIAHHIITDVWSLALILGEVRVLYEAFQAGRPSPLPPPPFQFADFAHWQRQWLSGEVLEEHLAWWRKQLAGAPAALELPTDRPRPRVQTHRGTATPLFSFPPDAVRGLRKLAVREGATFSMVLQAAFHALLHRYSGQEDISIGMLSSGRTRAETEGLIGFFFNPLVLRLDLSGDPTFRELLARAREVALGAFAHQDLPFETLVKELKPERDLGRTPFFQVLLDFQGAQPVMSLPGLSVSHIGSHNHTAKFDLSLTLLDESDAELRGALEYSTDLFDTATVERMMAAYRVLLEGVVARPEARLGELPLLSAEEQRRLLVEWNDTHVGYPSGESLHGLFQARAAANPDAVALTFEDQSLSYRELDVRSNRLARRLRALGVGPEVLVGLCLERSLDLVVGLFAILKAGGAYVPLDPSYPRERLAAMLEDSGAPLVLTHSRLAASLPPGAPRLALDSLAEELSSLPGDALPGPAADPDSLAYVIFTSGSTGRPKGAMNAHRGVVNRLRWMQDTYPLAPSDVVLQKTPFSFDVSVWEFFWPLLWGARLVLARPEGHKDPAYLVHLIRREGVTTLHFVPSMLQAFLAHPEAGACGTLRQVFCSGEALPFELQEHFFQRLPAELHNLYGPTEAAVDVTFWRCERGGSRRSVPIGRPVANTRTHVLDARLQPQPIGVPGELYLGGVQVGRGYRGRPELTAERFIPDPFSPEPGARLYRTGDRARVLSDGTIEYLGRLDHQVKLRGFRIELGEIEAALRQHPTLADAAVLAREDNPGDKRLVAYVVARGGEPLPPGELRAHLQRTLPEYMVPSAFVALDALPVNANGKLDRKALPAPEGTVVEASRYAAPRTPLEELLATAFAELLRVERVGLHDGFFELGGHSLLATQLASRVRQAFGVELPVRVLFEAPTVGELAPRLEALLAGAPHLQAPPLVARPRQGPPPLSFAQERLWFIEQLAPGGATYNIPAPSRLTGPLDVAVMERALAEVVRRHEALRTTFSSVEGRPIQVISPALPLSLPVQDLSNLPPAEREPAVLRRVEEDARRPFDLERGPLLRVALLRLAPEEHVLLVTMHHLVTDGWSMGLFFEEVIALYGAFLEGRPSPLPELPLQYADFARWQREWLAGEVLETQLAWWSKQLAGAPTALELPTDRPRPPMQTFNGALSAERRLRLPFVQTLHQLARREGATLFMVLEAAFHTLLQRYSGQDDLLVGTPIAGRNRGETERLIGLFVNTLVLRVDLAGDPTFPELLGRVREAALGAYAHQDLPFEKLVDELKPERDLSRSAFFQVLINLQTQPPAPKLAGLVSEPLMAQTGTAKFDLWIAALEGEEGLSLTFEYNTDLFDASTIERMAAHLCTLLEGIATRPEARVSQLPMLPEAERHRLLREWNDTRAPYPDGATLHGQFEAQARRTPHAVAAVFEGQALTYRQLDQRANGLAHRLVRLGVGPEVRAALCVERSIELLIAMLGVLKAGGAYVPVDPAYPKDRIAFMLRNGDAVVLLTQRRLLPGLPEEAPPLLLLDGDEPLEEREDAPRGGAGPCNLAYIIHTSGSTGRPKGVAVRHRPAVNLVHWVNTTYRVGPGDRVLFVTSPCFDLSVYDVFGLLAAGGAIHVASEADIRDPDRLARLLREEPITFWDSAPAALQQLTPSFGSGSTALRLVFLSGDWIPLSLPGAVRAAFPQAHVIGLGGATEAAIWSNHFPIGALDPSWRSIPYGRPIQNARYYVLDRSLQPCPVRVAGDLYIGGECLAEGYANDPRLTAEKFVPDPFSGVPGARMYRTGDRARFFPDGNIEFLGRLDHQVKIRGYRIELGEIESVLRQHPGLKEAVVVAREDVPGDKRLVAYVIPAGEQAPAAAELKALLQEKLPEYMVPSAFVALQALPVTSNGKLDRKALPAPERQAPAGEGFAAPRTPLEELVADTFAGLLGLERVGLHDSFFDLGGHSLLATQAASRLRQRFNVELPLRALFEEPTVAGFARNLQEAIARGQQLQAPPLAPVPREGPPPLSFAQERLWFLDQLTPGSSAYNVSTANRLLGALDVGALKRALGELLRRHEALRTTFAAVEGQPVQIIAPAGPPDLPEVDLSGLPLAEREAAVLLRAEQDARRPFDLAAGPLFRAELVRLAPEEHVLLMAMHHIVTDGWSMGLLFGELGELYGAFREGQPSPLPELPLQYADFAWWQRRWLKGEVLDAQLAWWRERLAGAPTALELPTDRPRPPMQTSNGSFSPEFALSPELSRALHRLARAEGVTLFMLLEAAFHVLLSRYSGQRDILVGTPIAGRNRSETEGLIGLFVNTLVLRADLSGDPGFHELLGRVREAALGAYAHQDIPFEKLVDELKPERDLSRSPFFQVVFDVVTLPPARGLPGLVQQPLTTRSSATKCDLWVYLFDGADGLVTGTIEYNTDLFDASTIDRMTGHLRVLMEGIVARPEARVSALPLLPEAERRRMLVEWNDTRADFPEACFPALFEAQVARTPDAPAVLFEGQALTYRELNARANRWARFLVRQGIGPDSVVPLLDERGPRLLTAILATFKAGAAYLPLDPRHPARRLLQVLEQAGAPLVLAAASCQAPLAEAVALLPGDRRPRVLDFGELPTDGPADDLPPRSSPGNLAYVIFTSGSTGAPKGAMLEQRGLINHLTLKVRDLQLSASDVVAQTASQCFDVSVWQFLTALLVGGRTLILGDEVTHQPRALLLALEQEGVTIAETVPTLQRALLDEAAALGPDRPSLSRLRTLVNTGEALPPDLCARWFQLHPHVPLLNSYGPTECTDDVTQRLLREAPRSVNTPVGRPVANMRAYVLDEALQPVPIGVTGELYAGGVGVGRGYFGRPDLTAERFLADPFVPGGRLYRTGDLARFLPDGTLEYLGRADFQVKVRGFRIELGEIEAVLRQHPGLARAVVLAREDEPGDRRLVAYVVPAGAPVPAAELRDFLQRRLPDYMVPSAFVALEALPVNANGKLDRKALPRPDRSAVDARAFVPPRGPLEELVAGLWAELLGLRQVGARDGFFDLGGHSLLATRLVSRLRQVLQVELPIRALFEEPTVAGIARRLEALAAGDRRLQAPPPGPVPRRGPPPLSFAQQQLWFLDQLAPGSSAYNIPSAHRLRGPLDAGALERALGELVRRHEVLRTTFAAVEGQPVQLIAPAAPLALPVVDLSGLPPPGREAALQRRVEEDARRPFDLARGPLLRVELLRLAPEEHVLLVTLHHIVTDAWSMDVFFEELVRLYEAFREGRPSPLPELPLQYADFASWQRQWLQGEVLDAQLGYWRQQLAGAPASLDLPTDRPRPAVQTWRGADTPFFELPPELTLGLRQLARREGATIFMVLEAAFHALLHRYSGQEDLVVAVSVTGRNRGETEGLIGFFVNTLLLRVDLGGAPTFRELLGRVRETTLGAYAHQDLPFDKLVEELKPERDPSRPPFSQVKFNLIRAAPPATGMAGLELQPLEASTGTAKFDLLLTGLEMGDGLSLSFNYNTDLFDASTIDRMMRHLRVLLEGLATHPEARVAELPLLSGEERHRQLVEWNATGAELPGACVHELFEGRAARAPDAPAVVADDGQLTHGELNRRANRLAHHLRALGVRPETLVGLYVERSVDALVGLLGILKAGGAYVPLDPAHPSERLLSILADAGASLLVSQQALADRLTGYPGTVVRLDADRELLSRQSEANPTPAAGPGNLVYAIFTSGSTGRPKGVAVEHRQLSNYLQGVSRRLELPEGASFASVSTLAADLGNTAIFPTLANGGTLHLVSRDRASDPALLAGAFERAAVDCLKIVPTHLAALLTSASPARVLPRRRLVLGGDVSDWGLIERLHALAPECVVFNHYGPTETTVGVLTYRVPREGRPGSANVPLGKPIPNIRIYLLDGHLQPLPAGVPGELYIGGAGVARGYLGRPELTAERFVPDPFSPTPGARLYRTGDRARYLPDGDVEFLGRVDHQIKIRGFRIELGEVEAVLERHPAVQQAVVVVREDTPGEKRLVGYAAPRPGQALDVTELRRFLKDKLPDYMVPGTVVMLDALPLNTNGKVDRKALPSPDAASAPRGYVAPRDPFEQLMASLWTELLGIERVGAHDDFFQLGGHSLVAPQLVVRIQESFGVELPLQEVFIKTTLSAMVEEVRRLVDAPWRGPVETASPVALLRPGGARAPLFCVHPAFGDTLPYVMLANLLTTDQAAYALRAPELYSETVFATLEERAACYLESVRALQPAGPYRLLGYSSGGVVALEMARQLLARGEQVELLALIDRPASVPPPQPPVPPDLDDVAYFAHTHMSPEERLRFQALPSGEERQRMVFELLRQMGMVLSAAKLEDMHGPLRAVAATNRAIDAYAVRPYPGRLILFTSEEGRALGDPALGWEALSPGGLEVHAMKGTHRSMMSHPHVRDLARLLDGYLTRLDAAARTPTSQPVSR